MKAKIRPHNLAPEHKKELNKAAREYIRENLTAVDNRLKLTYTRRITTALCLVLNDQYNFGARRVWRAVMGLGEILDGICDEVYSKRDEDDPNGPDRAVDAMILELADRGIYVQLDGDPIYGSEEYLKQLLGDKYKPPLDMDGRKRKSPAGGTNCGRSKK